MSAWRFTAAAAALCLFACSATASTKQSASLGSSTGSLAQYKKTKAVGHQQRAWPRTATQHGSRRLAIHRRSHRSAARKRLRGFAARSTFPFAETGAREFSGVASYYFKGHHLASGGLFSPDGMTAAHRTLPFGTRLHVVDLTSGRSVDVTINDRGPFSHGRVLDLSRGAAHALGMTPRGVARIRATMI